ncbi:hypothetical protein AJ80_03342 [Polytolypa hystricis UAMH7299]|uniref:Uncharacterized protein n=1 Tax=Polytolypa hystricis (strain UAMH7299) TaxID=1447883 RepID=A0A2B7YKB8_POLH7|nr:hypothetical protein AJ80_03342 [Polytolypa hystricis UAMH7299]
MAPIKAEIQRLKTARAKEELEYQRKDEKIRQLEAEEEAEELAKKAAETMQISQ